VPCETATTAPLWRGDRPKRTKRLTAGLRQFPRALLFRRRHALNRHEPAESAALPILSRQWPQHGACSSAEINRSGCSRFMIRKAAQWPLPRVSCAIDHTNARSATSVKYGPAASISKPKSISFRELLSHWRSAPSRARLRRHTVGNEQSDLHLSTALHIESHSPLQDVLVCSHNIARPTRATSNPFSSWRVSVFSCPFPRIGATKSKAQGGTSIPQGQSNTGRLQLQPASKYVGQALA